MLKSIDFDLAPSPRHFEELEVQRKSVGVLHTGVEYDAFEFAVVIPVYGHSVLLSEAVQSALAQTVNDRLAILIVNDGCPYEETNQLCLALSIRFSNIIYVNQENAGPSAARNAAIDFITSHLHNARAVFFLDADNRLSRNAIATGWALLEVNPNVDWIYPDINGFESEWTGYYSIPYSRLLHVIHGNMCDTGSLVRIRMLRQLRFNVDERSSFEDWDFWLSAIAAGYAGMPCSSLGLEYRIRAESRNKESIADQDGNAKYLRRRYKHVFTPRKLLTFEHVESPRFVYFEADHLTADRFSDANASRDSPLQLTDFVQLFKRAVAEPEQFSVPNIFVLGQGAALRALADHGLVYGTLGLIQRKLEISQCVVVTCRYADNLYKVEESAISEANPIPNVILLLAARRDVVEDCARDKDSEWLRSLDSNVPSPKVFHLTIQLPFETKPLCLTRREAVRRICDIADSLGEMFREETCEGWNWRTVMFPRIDEYPRLLAEYLTAEAPFPITKTPERAHVGVIVPIGSFGGAEKVAYATAKALRKAGYDTHLFVVGPGGYQVISEFADAFTTINLVGQDAPSIWGGRKYARGLQFAGSDEEHVKAPVLRGMLAAMDVIINCHSAAVNTILADLRRNGAICVSYLHVFDRTTTAREIGHPFLAILFEHAYDLILLCSNNLMRRMHGLGIPLAKMLSIQNAPSFAIAKDDLTRIRKARSRATGDLRVLYIGRMDYQKGIERIIGIAEACRKECPGVGFRFVGASLLEEGVSPALLQSLERLNIILEPPIYRSDQLQAAMEAADVIILPSRWEGAPLIILESQVCGCIPVATDVGAVSELIATGVDGVVVPDTHDWLVIRNFVAAISRLQTDVRLRQKMALDAMDRMADTSWDRSLRPFLDALDVRIGVKRSRE